MNSNQINQQSTLSCETCFRIACKQCSWVATDEEVQLIQQGTLTACPECGWKPGEKVLI